MKWIILYQNKICCIFTRESQTKLEKIGGFNKNYGGELTTILFNIKQVSITAPLLPILHSRGSVDDLTRLAD